MAANVQNHRANVQNHRALVDRVDPSLSFKLEDLNHVIDADVVKNVNNKIHVVELRNGNVRVRVNASFRTEQGGFAAGRTVGFEIEAKTVRVALEMIEAYGRQMISYEKLDAAQTDPKKKQNFNFTAFHQKRINKPIPLYAAIKADQNENGLEKVTITFYKHVHPRNDLIYYFGGKRGEPQKNSYDISDEALKMIKDMADGKAVKDAYDKHQERRLNGLRATITRDDVSNDDLELHLVEDPIDPNKNV